MPPSRKTLGCWDYCPQITFQFLSCIFCLTISTHTSYSFSVKIQVRSFVNRYQWHPTEVSGSLQWLTGGLVLCNWTSDVGISSYPPGMQDCLWKPIHWFHPPPSAVHSQKDPTSARAQITKRWTEQYTISAAAQQHVYNSVVFIFPHLFLPRVPKYIFRLHLLSLLQQRGVVVDGPRSPCGSLTVLVSLPPSFSNEKSAASRRDHVSRWSFILYSHLFSANFWFISASTMTVILRFLSDQLWLSPPVCI